LKRIEATDVQLQVVEQADGQAHRQALRMAV
jgi:hypothetical protein